MKNFKKLFSTGNILIAVTLISYALLAYSYYTADITQLDKSDSMLSLSSEKIESIF
jgi:hypothetical protein